MSVNKKMNSLDILKARIAQEDARRLEERDKGIDENFKRIQENTSYLDMASKSRTIANRAVVKANAIQAIKSRLLENCIYVIAKEAYGEDEPVLRRLAANYIQENGGPIKIHNKFKHSTELLSEFALEIDKYMERILKESEDCDDDDCEVNYKIDPETEDEFCEKIAYSNIDDIVEVIKKRVEEAIEDFISKNAEDKDKLKEIIDRAQNKIEGLKNEKVAESYIISAKRAMNQVKDRRPMQLLEAMVNNISKDAVKNPENSPFITEGTLDVETVMEKTVVLYTFLETLNTAKIENIDEVFIKDVYEGRK